MRLLLFTALSVAVQAASPPPPKPLPREAELAARHIAECGFHEVHVTRDQYGYTIHVDDVTATQEQLTCAVRVSYNDVTAGNGSVRVSAELDAAYNAIFSQMLEETTRRDAEAAIPRMTGCGFKTMHLKPGSYKYEYVIVVEDRTATTKQLLCAARIQLNSYELSHSGIRFPDNLSDVYSAIYERLEDEDANKQARELLARRGVLSRVPRYRPGKSNVLALARSLERLCGPKARGAFRMSKPGRPTTGIMREVVGQVTWDEDVSIDYETKLCLYAAVRAAGLPSYSLYADH